MKTMNTDQLDLLQMHDMRTEEDIEVVSSRGVALEAFKEAKERNFTLLYAPIKSMLLS